MIQPEYNYAIVALSFVIAWFGSYTALNLAVRIPTATEKAKTIAWLTKAAIAIGGGIWSMHFIGMLAYDMQMTVRYDIAMTVISLVIAIIVCGIGLFIVSLGSTSLVRLIIAGVITGAGVATMHYLGMAAMKMQATMSYNMPLFYVSIAIAMVAATAALWLAFNMRGAVQQFVSSIVMAIAVCGMHYTGMAAMEYSMLEGHTMVESNDNAFVLALVLATAASALFSSLLYISVTKDAKRELQLTD